MDSYVIFDLEWNQCPYGKEREIPELPFEIIEIGAVKMNSRREIVDTFHTVVRPVHYRSLHFRTKEIVSLTKGELRAGMLFPDAAEAFFAFCGRDARLCTWGPGDLTELQRNLAFYRMQELLPGPVFYEDVQKLFALAYETRKDRRSLSYAADHLGLTLDGEFHHALDDAVYTAKVFAKIPEEIAEKEYSVDTYQNPASREEEIRIRYDTYEKFISMEFDSAEAALRDPEVNAIRCFSCHKNVKRNVRWFTDGGHNYLAVGVCPEHGYVKSKARMRRSRNGRIYVIKTTKLISEDEFERISDRRRRMKERRKARHHAKGEGKGTAG